MNNNEYEEWIENQKQNAWECVAQIARAYEDYHNYSYNVCDKIGKVLEDYGFLDN